MLHKDFYQTDLFRHLQAEQMALVRPLFKPCFESDGSILFEQGDAAEHLYILTEGEVNIRYKPEDGPELNVAHVRSEGVVGWSAALGNPTYTSSAICATDCYMLCVRGQDLRWLCEQYPEVGSVILDHLATLIAERLRNTHNHVVALLKQGLKIDIEKPIPA